MLELLIRVTYFCSVDENAVSWDGKQSDRTVKVPKDGRATFYCLVLNQGWVTAKPQPDRRHLFCCFSDVLANVSAFISQQWRGGRIQLCLGEARKIPQILHRTITLPLVRKEQQQLELLQLLTGFTANKWTHALGKDGCCSPKYCSPLEWQQAAALQGQGCEVASAASLQRLHEVSRFALWSRNDLIYH